MRNIYKLNICNFFARNSPGLHHYKSLLGVVLLAGFFMPVALSALEITLQVIDPANRRPIANAQVIVAEIRRKFRTDGQGRVRFNVPRTGTYTIRVITPDGRFFQPRIQVQSDGQTLTIYAGKPPTRNDPKNNTQTVQEGEGIQVQGYRRKQKVSRYQVRLDEIKRIPGQFGEALRGIETLPGINSPPFGNGDIVIRGANSNANTYLLDRLPIGYAFHFFPVNSVLANDLIKTIDLYNGAYPANFGNATGGVIDIATIDEVDKFGGNANFSLWSANVLFKGPMLQDDSNAGLSTGSAQDSGNKDEPATGTQTRTQSGQGSSGGSYWIGAVRGSYMDQTLKQFAPDGVQLPIYYDAQIKLKFQLNPYHALYFYALGAKDTFAAEFIDKGVQYDPTKEVDPVLVGARLAIDEAFHTEALRHQWQPGTQLRNELTMLYHNNITHLNGRIGDIEADQKIEEGWASLIDEMDWVLMPRHIRLEAGLEYRQFLYRNNGFTFRITDPNDESPEFFSTGEPDFQKVIVHDSHQTPYISGFSMLTLAAWGFEFKPGFRYDYFGLTEQTVVDPRGTLSYTFETGTSLFTGTGIYHKVPESREYSPSSGNKDLRMERAEHYAGGVEQVWNAWTFRIEAFRNYFTDIVVEDPYITTPYKLNEDEYTRYSNPILYDESLGYSNDGTGFSEGIEILIKKDKKPEANGWYGWISYTWSRSIRNNHQHIISEDESLLVMTRDEQKILNQYDNTKDGYADFDRTHIINIIFGYQFSREWQVGARWLYKTAAPFTEIIGDDGGQQENAGRTIYDPRYSTLTNTRRLHPYHRLDLRIDRFMHYEWGYGNFYVEMLNVYVRENPSQMDWDRKRPYSATNPSISNDFLILQTPGSGKTYLLPFFNIGLEMKF